MSRIWESASPALGCVPGNSLQEGVDGAWPRENTEGGALSGSWGLCMTHDLDPGIIRGFIGPDMTRDGTRKLATGLRRGNKERMVALWRARVGETEKGEGHELT